jgi:hypothetical protein
MSVTGLKSMMTKRMWSPISSRRFLEMATFSRMKSATPCTLANQMAAARGGEAEGGGGGEAGGVL